MRMTGALVALACLGAAFAAPTRAAAQTKSITCESKDDARRDCYVSNLDPNSVSVDRQLSRTDCDRGRTWGTSRNNIWVSSGCRAVFRYRTGYSSGYNPDYGSGNGGGSRYGTITCESHDNNRKECRVTDLEESSVTMNDQLSDAPCISGRSWGTSYNTIWVSKGCRARFAYVRRSGGGNNNGYGYGGGASSSSMRQACIYRASRDWAVTEDNLEVTGTNRLDNGETEVLIKSKRTQGSCYVDSNGRVRKLSTW